MPRKLFFSVIIPTLNEEKYLPTLLNSLANQTYRDFEVIVIDGRSKDRTKEVFEKFALRLPSASFILSDKSNVGHQRNLGATKAQGEYLVFLDADCDIAFTFLEELHVAALKQKFPFATTWIKPDSHKTIDQMMILLTNLAVEATKGIGKPFSGGYNTIIKKDVFLKLKGFREDLKINEDHDFAIRAGKNNIEVIILKEPQVTYSLRRFRAQGILPVLRKYAEGQIYYLLKGPLKDIFFDYPMGGNVHEIKRRRKRDLMKIDTYFTAMRKLERKILKLFKD